jgi:CheY-like chemotaxis protein
MIVVATKILLVNDDEVALISMLDVLERSGFAVTCATARACKPGRYRWCFDPPDVLQISNQGTLAWFCHDCLASWNPTRLVP